MRIWLVPFKELDDQRVLAQHREVHALWSLIVENGRPWHRTWSDPRYRWALWNVHERAVKEMYLRGFPSGADHKTPIRMPRTQPVRFPWTRDLVRHDRRDLMYRWGGVYMGRGREPEAYRDLRRRFNREGCLHDGPIERIDFDMELCLICKAAVRDRGGRRWRRR